MQYEMLVRNGYWQFKNTFPLYANSHAICIMLVCVLAFSLRAPTYPTLAMQIFCIDIGGLVIRRRLFRSSQRTIETDQIELRPISGGNC